MGQGWTAEKIWPREHRDDAGCRGSKNMTTAQSGRGSSRSPYVVGAGIGILNTLAFLTAKRGLGVTTAFENTVALSGRKVAPDLLRVNSYLKARDDVPKIDWETLLVAGLPIGSFLAARASGEPRSDDRSAPRMKSLGNNVGTSLAVSFLGGALMMFGARLAKGCTSGHGITGTSQLALSSLVFTPLMFATAGLVASALYGRGES